MNYPIPANSQEIMALSQQNSVDEALVATAIAGVVKIARSQGQSLDDLTAEVLADDQLLDNVQRNWLSKIVAEAWDAL